MQLIKYVAFAGLFALGACNAENKSEEKKDTVAVQSKEEVQNNLNFKDEKVANLYRSYTAVKDNLVDSKFEDTKTTAKSLAENLSNYTGCENTSLIAKKIEDAKDIAEQRKQFTALSSDVIALFKHAELTGGTIFVQHCPMANKGDGGDWLSSNKKIQNPYYGSEMMECGAVVEEIKSK